MSCRNVYKAGGFITRYGSLQAYRKVLAKKDGHLKHAEFLACLKGWMKQHDENPEQTKLKDNNRLMEVQKTLSAERRQTGEVGNTGMRRMENMMRPRWCRSLWVVKRGQGFGRRRARRAIMNM